MVRGKENRAISGGLGHRHQVHSQVPRGVRGAPQEVEPAECQQDRKEAGGIVHPLAQLAGARVGLLDLAAQ